MAAVKGSLFTAQLADVRAVWGVQGDRVEGGRPAAKEPQAPGGGWGPAWVAVGG